MLSLSEKHQWSSIRPILKLTVYYNRTCYRKPEQKIYNTLYTWWYRTIKSLKYYRYNHTKGTTRRLQCCIDKQRKSWNVRKSLQKAHELSLIQLTDKQKTINNIAKIISCLNHGTPPPHLSKYLTNPTEIQKFAKTFSNGKTPGLDGITYRLIKTVARHPQLVLSAALEHISPVSASKKFRSVNTTSDRNQRGTIQL